MSMKMENKRRIRITICVIFVAILGGLVWWAIVYRTTITLREGESEQATNVAQGLITGTNAQMTSSQAQIGATGAVAQPNAPSVRSETVRSAYQNLNVPISFWGMVVDQEGKPLAQVKIEAAIRQWGLGSRLSFEKVRRETGQDGRFQIFGAKGDSLRFERIEKEGHVLSPRAQTSFGYNISTNHIPESGNPVVFRLWKTGSPQLLVNQRFSRVGIPCDGTPVYFDFMTGKKNSQGGDLRVSFVRRPTELTSPREKHDWSLKLEIENGGLVLSEDEFMLLAPRSGYKQSVEFAMSKDDPGWTPLLKKQFYVKVRGRLFGRLSVELSTDRQSPPTGATFESCINPSGSASLEGGLKAGPEAGVIE